MAGKVLKMNNMNKINNSTIMNKSAENPATTHTYNRYGQLDEETKNDKSHRLNRNEKERSVKCFGG